MTFSDLFCTYNSRSTHTGDTQTTMQNPAYAQMLANSTGARSKVAYAWVTGAAAAGSNFKTDGRTVWSYAHIVGVTLADGSKVAYDCAASQTTRKQTGPMRVIADRITGCDTHSAHTAPRQYIG